MACSFSWGGLTWGPGDLDSFKAWLSAHGADYATWASEHPDADACLQAIAPWEEFGLFFIETPLPSDDLDGYAARYAAAVEELKINTNKE